MTRHTSTPTAPRSLQDDLLQELRPVEPAPSAVPAVIRTPARVESRSATAVPAPAPAPTAAAPRTVPTPVPVQVTRTPLPSPTLELRMTAQPWALLPRLHPLAGGSGVVLSAGPLRLSLSLLF